MSLNNPSPIPQIFSDPPESKQAFSRRPSNYFVFKKGRRPSLNIGPRPKLPDAEAPAKDWDAFFNTNAGKDGPAFVTQKMLDDAGVAADSPIRNDVLMLNRTLVRTFIDEDYNANYWQNQYFLFQWLFNFFALFATIFAALTTYAAVWESATVTQQVAQPVTPVPAIVLTLTASPSPTGTPVTVTTPVVPLTSEVPNSGWASVFGLLTTLSGVVVTALVYIYNRDRPQRIWYEKRRNAESLRTQYFLYLTHMPPYDNKRHAFALQMMVTRIQNSDATKLDIPVDTPPRTDVHTDADIPILLRLYNELRIQPQMIYYKQRNREYDFDADITLLFTLIVPLVVSVLAGLNIARTNPVLATVIIVLPSVAALFATFQRVYDWDFQQVLYSKTFQRLQAAKIIDFEGKTPAMILRELVNNIETELSKEANQWGSSLSENNTEISAEQIIDAFKKKATGTAEENQTHVDNIRAQLKLPAVSPSDTIKTDPNAAPDLGTSAKG